MTHSDLVEAGRKWLAARSPVVITEVRAAAEIPDVLGFNCTLRSKDFRGYGSVVIECKATRADYLSDRKKLFRHCPSTGMGRFRYYLTPRGMVTPDELPAGWGMLETQGVRVKMIREAVGFPEYNSHSELLVLISTMRRLRLPPGEHTSLTVKSYTYESRNTATLTIGEVSPEEEAGDLH